MRLCCHNLVACFKLRKSLPCFTVRQFGACIGCDLLDNTSDLLNYMTLGSLLPLSSGPTYQIIQVGAPCASSSLTTAAGGGDGDGDGLSVSAWTITTTGTRIAVVPSLRAVGDKRRRNLVGDPCGF